MAELFWENVAILLAEKEMTWADLTRKMFVGTYKYPSEFNRHYQKIRHYKSAGQMPQTKWVEKIVAVLEVDYEDLFRR